MSTSSRQHQLRHSIYRFSVKHYCSQTSWKSWGGCCRSFPHPKLASHLSSLTRRYILDQFPLAILIALIGFCSTGLDEWLHCPISFRVRWNASKVDIDLVQKNTSKRRIRFRALQEVMCTDGHSSAMWSKEAALSSWRCAMTSSFLIIISFRNDMLIRIFSWSTLARAKG
jgi:hypothetical protein